MVPGAVKVPARMPCVNATKGWEVAPLPVSHPESVALIRQYYDDIAGRYYGRPVTTAELDAIVEEFTSDDLTAPTGHFLVGWYDGRSAGCAGLRVLDMRTAELTRVYIRPGARGTGGGGQRPNWPPAMSSECR
ncbi:MAG: acetyltransferase [Streptomyces oryziradicis]|nr:acetyltransferase [Actinacidiphila oryziradicis]